MACERSAVIERAGDNKAQAEWSGRDGAAADGWGGGGD